MPRPALRPVPALLALLVLVLAGCGSAGHGDEPAAGATKVRTAADGEEFNGVDVDFATGMIPHHADALQMVDLTQGRRLSPEVQDLVTGIRDAQTAEIQTMTGWLTDWDQEVPETGRDHVNAGHGEHAMASEDLEELERAPDAEFEQTWLEMMVEHHEGALEMAATERADGHFPEAVALARQVQKTQRAEIATMEGLLDS